MTVRWRAFRAIGAEIFGKTPIWVALLGSKSKCKCWLRRKGQSSHGARLWDGSRRIVLGNAPGSGSLLGPQHGGKAQNSSRNADFSLRIYRRRATWRFGVKPQFLPATCPYSRANSSSRSGASPTTENGARRCAWSPNWTAHVQNSVGQTISTVEGLAPALQNPPWCSKLRRDQ